MISLSANTTKSTHKETLWVSSNLCKVEYNMLQLTERSDCGNVDLVFQTYTPNQRKQRTTKLMPQLKGVVIKALKNDHSTFKSNYCRLDFLWPDRCEPLYLKANNESRWKWDMTQSRRQIRQKGESQNRCFKKTKRTKFSEKRTFLTPWYAHVRVRINLESRVGCEQWRKSFEN